MSLGIEKNEKCLYIVDDRTKNEVVDFFKKQGFDVEEFIEAGQFEFLTKSESYLKDGRFDSDKMINLLKEAKKEALEEGYNGLRVTGEMTWFFSDMPGVERLMEYESKLNEFVPSHKVIALCQYNEKRFPPEVLVDVLRTHRRVLIYDELHENPYYLPPRVFVAQMNGKVTWEHYEGMKEDIIQRTRLRKEEEEAEKRLEEEKERAQKYLETAEVMIVGIDSEGEVIQANRKASEVLGYDKEDIVGKNWFENFIPEDARDELREIHQMAGENRYPEYFENPVLTSSNEERTILWHNSILKDEEGDIIGTLSSGMDITERKEKEKELQKSKRQLDAILNDPDVFMGLLDTDGTLVKANSSSLNFVGVTHPEVEGKKFWNTPWWTHSSELQEKLKQAIEKARNGEIVRFEATHEGKNGEEITVDFSLRPVRNEDGEIVSLIASSKNITERKRAKERKEFLNTLLRQDLGSKYQTIRGYLQLFEEEADIPEEQKKYLKKAIEAGREGDEILGLAKRLGEIEQADWIGEKDIIKVLEQIIEDISSYVEKEGVEIEKTYPDAEIKVEGDYSLNILFSQILLTRKQISEFGTIKIDAEEREEDVLVRIEDNGEPLPEDVKNIFSGEPYTGETTGVGGVRYYMIRQIAEHNNAEIEVQDSNLGGAGLDVRLKKAQ